MRQTSYSRLAVALQQIYAHWYGGQTKDERSSTFGDKVRTLMLRASELAASGRTREEELTGKRPTAREHANVA